MGHTADVHIRIPESQKRRWLKHVQARRTTLSAYVRGAVEAAIERDRQDARGGSGEKGAARG